MNTYAHLFSHDPELLQEMYEYCLQDVRVEREISQIVRPLNQLEMHDYHVNERINDRGLLIDTWWCEQAQAFADMEVAELEAAVTAATSGEVTKKSGAGLAKWVLSRLSDEALDLTVVYKNKEKKHSLDKSVRYNLLLQDNESPGFIGPAVRLVLEAADAAGKSSVAKYKKMLWLADPDDDRLRGAFVFTGAGQTGRYSSHGAQIHNYPRKSVKYPDAFLDHVELTGALPDSDDGVMGQLSQMLRPTIIADDGNTFVCGDWSQIEARFLPWLADDSRAEAGVLAAFRAKDIDPALPGLYEVTGAGIYHIPVDDVTEGSTERLMGKIACLALGFGGGKGAFQAMAKAFGVAIPDEEAESIKEAWRAANPWAVPFWNALMNGFTNAFIMPGEPVRVRRVIYQFEPQINNTMFCQLPSGRTISYPDVRREIVDGNWGPQVQFTYLKGNLVPKKNDKDWVRRTIWRGLLAENCVSANAEVLTKDGWVPLLDVGLRPVWDGEDWVRHEGLVWKGDRFTIKLWGLGITPDHKVLVNDSWTPAIRAQRSGFDRPNVRLPDSATPGEEKTEARALGVRMRMRKRYAGGAGGLAKRWYEFLRLQDPRTDSEIKDIARYDQASGLRSVAEHDRSLSAPVTSSVETLWRAGHYGMRPLARVFRKLLGRHGAMLGAGLDARSPGQQRWLLKRELCMGGTGSASEKYPSKSVYQHALGPNDSSRSQRKKFDKHNNDTLPAQTSLGQHRCGDDPAQLSEPVYDIKNCGPRHRFVVRSPGGFPLIVHNCTQAGAADVLRDGLRVLDGMNCFVIGDTHDEILIECPEDESERWFAALKKVMLTVPEWAPGLPLNAGLWISPRYRK